jgi:hypothetical protein
VKLFNFLNLVSNFDNRWQLADLSIIQSESYYTLCNCAMS